MVGLLHFSFGIVILYVKLICEMKEDNTHV